MESIQLRFTQTEKEYLAATRLLTFQSKGVLPRLFLAFSLIVVLLVSLMLL